jgi:hypothetical protein
MTIRRAPFDDNGSWMLSPHHAMHPNNFLKSKNGQYTLLLREDGNLVLLDGANQIWTANESQPYSATLQHRKKRDPIVLFIAHSAFLQDPPRKRLWIAQATQTRDKTAWEHTYLALQNDGNILLLDIELWTQNRNIPFMPKTKHLLEVAPDVSMPVNEACRAGPYSFIFQSNGDLIALQENGTQIWASGTGDRGATAAIMKSDGNFAITNTAGVVLWQTGTAGHPDCWPCMQDNGKFAMIKETVTWGRFGFTPGRLPLPRKIYFTHDRNFNTKDFATIKFG